MVITGMWKNNKNRYGPFSFLSSGYDTGAEGRATRKNCKGITLVELILALAIIGILATLSAPSYFKYVQQGKLSEAFATFLNLTARIEAKYLDNRNYAVIGDAGTCVISETVALSSNDDWTFSCTVSGANSGQYLLTVESSDGTYRYTLDQSGVRQTLAFPNLTSATNGCWHKSNVAGDCF